MLKRFAHFWLMLSILFAPLQYAMAELNQIADAEQSHCEMASSMSDSTASETSTLASVEQSPTQQSDSCECCTQCESSCATCLHFTAMLFPIQSDSSQPTLSHLFTSAADQATSITPLSEFRPPRV